MSLPFSLSLSLFLFLSLSVYFCYGSGEVSGDVLRVVVVILRRDRERKVMMIMAEVQRRRGIWYR